MESLGDILKKLTPESGLENTDYQNQTDDGSESNSPPECDICGDFGWVRLEVPVSHAYFGKAIPCDCQYKGDYSSRIDRLQRYSNMGPLINVAVSYTHLTLPTKRIV